MGVIRISTQSVALALLLGCSPSPPPGPPPQPKTVFDPLTQQVDRAREVQNTVDQQADKARASIDSAERGDSAP